MKLIHDTFQNGPTALPIHNLGEICMIMGKHKEAMMYNDISLKTMEGTDPGNIMKFKIIAQLATILDLMG